MTHFINRSQGQKDKSLINRQRFLHRFKKHIKQSIDQSIRNKKISDIGGSESVSIPNKALVEAQIGFGPGGYREVIHAGNKEFSPGDRLPRPQVATNQQQGSQASNKGEGEDNFTFELTRDEFLDLFFDDLGLPDMIKAAMKKLPSDKWHRAGFTHDGAPRNINVIRTLRNAIARKIALSDKKKELPFIENVDIRYNYRVKHPAPTTQAVMLCLMDVSGSMDEIKKDIAKRFFIMLYLFLTRNYEKIDLIYIRHHTSAKEVDEDEFFYSRETGGTVVSSALLLAREIIEKRYSPNEWNIYLAQATDGDNWNADSPECQRLLDQFFLPTVQYYAYVEIMPRHHQSLWDVYQHLQPNHENFAMQSIKSHKDIYPVFRSLFKRQLS